MFKEGKDWNAFGSALHEIKKGKNLQRFTNKCRGQIFARIFNRGMPK